jgi:multidrug efflux system membrane fusion protein
MKKLLLVLALAVIACRGAEKDEDDEATATAGVTATTETSVTMKQDVAKQNGITVVELHDDAEGGGATAIGNATVVDVSELVSAASQYAAAAAQHEQAAARVNASRAELQRLRTLNADDHNVSDRAVQDAAATLAGDEAAVRAADVSALAAETSARQRWGATLAGGVLRGAPWARQLAARELVLVEAAFSDPTAGAAAATESIQITNASGRNVTARFLAASPHIDPRLQKPAFDYLAPADALPVGLITTIHGRAKGGVQVPPSAIVYLGDEALVFVEESPGRYVQHPLASLRAGQRVVTTGAQQLLSEQHKPEAE